MLFRLITSILVLTFTFAPLRSTARGSARNDAFHYKKSTSPFRDMMYSQMWYFNFIDDETGLAVVLGAGVVNPQQRLLAVGQTSAITALIRPSADGPSFYVWSPHYNPKDAKNFSASTTFAPASEAFRNPAMTIKVLDENTYLIQSSITENNRTVKANLTYSRVTDGLGSSWVPWQNVQLPHLFKIIPGRATYTMEMPDARVSGTVEVTESLEGKIQVKSYVIHNARGYHDGYFGSATLIPSFKWDWLSYQQDNVAIQMIDPHGPQYKCAKSPENCTPGNLRVAVKTPDGIEVVEFAKSQIKIQYDEMKIDKEYPSVPYPGSATIVGVDLAGNRVELHWKSLNYLKVFYHPPKPMKDLPTYEIVAELKGQFYSAKSKSETAIEGTAWVDYSNNP